MSSLVSKILHIWLGGGILMIPIFAVSVALYAQAFQLILYLRHANLSKENEAHWWDWVHSPEHAQGHMAEIIRYSQLDVSSAKQIRFRFDEIRAAWLAIIERRVRFMGSLIGAAPLLGLLGTVLGMLQTFYGLASGGGQEAADVVAAGISEALITTQAGLTVATPGLFIVMVIQRKKHEIEAKLARLESLTLRCFKFE